MLKRADFPAARTCGLFDRFESLQEELEQQGVGHIQRQIGDVQREFVLISVEER